MTNTNKVRIQAKRKFPMHEIEAKEMREIEAKETKLSRRLPAYLSHASYENLEAIVKNRGEGMLMLTDVSSVDLSHYTNPSSDVILKGQFEGNVFMFRANTEKVDGREVIGRSSIALYRNGDWDYSPIVPKGLIYTLQSIAHYVLELTVS